MKGKEALPPPGQRYFAMVRGAAPVSLQRVIHTLLLSLRGAAFAAIFAFIIIYYFCVGSTSARARTRTTPPLARARLRVVWCIPQALCHCRYAVLFLLAVLLLSASIFILGLVIPAPMS